MLGGVSGAVAASVTMPLDVAKTALQCGHHRSVTTALQECIQEKGVQGLFAGMVSLSMTAGLISAPLMIAVHCKLRRFACAEMVYSCCRGLV